MPEQSFNQLFSTAYNRARGTELTKSVQLRESRAMDAAGAKLGHPDFEHLKIGEMGDGSGVVFFLDIRGFTKLSFVLSNEELLRILQAVTEAAVRSILQFGGHVIEFTGDGVMAVFGSSAMAPEPAGFAALHTTAFLMDGIRSEVNPLLERFGADPVRTAVGMEFGEILWSRIGVLGTTQVKPISEATFLAGKLATSGYTKAWEAKVGGDLADWIPGDFKARAPKYSFVADGVEYSRDLFLFDWEKFGRENQSQGAALRTRVLGRRLIYSAHKSPYLSALKILTEAGYRVYFDDTADCPHLAVEIDARRGIDVIIAFKSESMDAVPNLFVRRGGRMEKIEIEESQWMQGGGNIVAVVNGVRNSLFQ
jgi:class 3 adenylate cyclase